MRLLSFLVSLITTALLAAGADVVPTNICDALRSPTKVSGKLVTVDGFIVSLMHGTFLKQTGCDSSILLVLPSEIPHYKGGISLIKDAESERFLDARANHLPDAPIFHAQFTGQLEYAGRGKGFGYDKNLPLRLILKSVTHSHTEPGRE